MWYIIRLYSQVVACVKKKKKKSQKYPKEIKHSACSWPLKAALTFCPGFPSCDKLVEQTKADQHLQGAAFHTWVEAEDGPLMTHSPPNHLEWTRSAGNRPETQPPRRPETWWRLPACQINPATAEGDEPPTTSQSYKPNMTEACYSLSYNADAIAEWSVRILQHSSLSWCAVQWCVITL